jgi:hypothetical protein
MIELCSLCTNWSEPSIEKEGESDVRLVVRSNALLEYPAGSLIGSMLLTTPAY